MFNNTKKGSDKNYAIIGLGRFGHALALELAQEGAEIMVIDKDEEKVRELRDYTENAFVVDGYDKKALEDTGVRNCDVAVVCIGEKIDISILMTLNLVSLGIPQVIAKATSEEHGEILRKLGAEVVYPERDMAVRLAHRLESAKILDYIQLSKKVNISKLIVPDKLIGKSVQEVDLRKRFGLNIIAIENNENVNQNVMPDYIFQGGDVLFLSGSADDFNRMLDWGESK